jgi:hypothetical protein
MQVLLRTASTLARACSDAAQRIQVQPTTRISVNQTGEVRDRLAEIASEAQTAIADVVALHSARAHIRRLIGEANNETVDRLLSERDALNQTEKFLTTIIDAHLGSPESERRRRLYGDATQGRPAHEATEVERALETVRQRIKTVTTGEVTDYVDVPTLPKAQVKSLQDQLAALRRRRTMLNDELAAANLRAHVNLPDDIVSVLRKHGILE